MIMVVPPFHTRVDNGEGAGRRANLSWGRCHAPIKPRRSVPTVLLAARRDQATITGHRVVERARSTVISIADPLRLTLSRVVYDGPRVADWHILRASGPSTWTPDRSSSTRLTTDLQPDPVRRTWRCVRRVVDRETSHGQGGGKNDTILALRVLPVIIFLAQGAEERVHENHSQAS